MDDEGKKSWKKQSNGEIVVVDPLQVQFVENYFVQSMAGLKWTQKIPVC